MTDKVLGPGAKCEPDCEFCTPAPEKPAPSVEDDE